MITTSPDGQWAAVKRGREVLLLAGEGGAPVARIQLPTEDADLVMVGPPSVLAVVSRGVDADGAPCNRVVLYQPPHLEPVARHDLDAGMRIAGLTGSRIVLVSLDGKAVTIVRVAGRALGVQSLDPGSPVEFAVGLERNQVLFGLLRKLETWDAVSARPLLRVQLPLLPPPRVVGPAHGFVWVTRPNTDDILVCRMSDGRPFLHQLGVPIHEVVYHPASPLLILVTPRGLVRLHCFAHSLTVIDAPWQLGTELAQLVVGDDISLLGLAAPDEEPWRVPIGGAGAPAITIDAPDPPGEPAVTAAGELRAMRERTGQDTSLPAAPEDRAAPTDRTSAGPSDDRAAHRSERADRTEPGTGSPIEGGGGLPGDRAERPSGFPSERSSGRPGDRTGSSSDRSERTGGFPDGRVERTGGPPGERSGFPGDRSERIRGFPGERTGGFPGERTGGFPGERTGSSSDRGDGAGVFPADRAERTGGFPGERTGSSNDRTERIGGFPGDRTGSPSDRSERAGGFPGDRSERAGGLPGDRTGSSNDRTERTGGFPNDRAERSGFPADRADRTGGFRTGGFPNDRAERSGFSADRSERTGVLPGDRTGSSSDRSDRAGGFPADRTGSSSDRSDRTGVLPADRTGSSSDRSDRTGVLPGDRTGSSSDRSDRTGVLPADRAERSGFPPDRADRNSGVPGGRAGSPSDRSERAGGASGDLAERAAAFPGRAERAERADGAERADSGAAGRPTGLAALRASAAGRPRGWRDALAGFGADLVRGGEAELPAVGDDTELGQLAQRLALPLAARRALSALYGAYLVGEPGLPLARLAQALGDWTEALGQGELAALAMLRRRGGRVALRGAVTDVLDGAGPRAIRMIGAAPAAPHTGAARLARDGRSDAAIESELASQLGRIAVIEGGAALALLEARLHGATALALAPPLAPPRPWPRDAGLVVVDEPAAPAWVAALPVLTAA